MKKGIITIIRMQACCLVPLTLSDYMLSEPEEKDSSKQKNFAVEATSPTPASEGSSCSELSVQPRSKNS